MCVHGLPRRWTPPTARSAGPSRSSASPGSSSSCARSARGVRRFKDIQDHLGISRSVLSDRLDMLEDNGILESRSYQEPGQRRRSEYHLTQKGRDLYPAITALRQWGDKYLADPEGPSTLISHRGCGAPVHAQLVCDAGHVVEPGGAPARAGPERPHARRRLMATVVFVQGACVRDQAWWWGRMTQPLAHRGLADRRGRAAHLQRRRTRRSPTTSPPRPAHRGRGAAGDPRRPLLRRHGHHRAPACTTPSRASSTSPPPCRTPASPRPTSTRRRPAAALDRPRRRRDRRRARRRRPRGLPVGRRRPPRPTRPSPASPASRAGSSPTRSPTAAWRTKPSTYLVCARDRAIPPEAQRGDGGEDERDGRAAHRPLPVPHRTRRRSPISSRGEARAR